jgi:hypothetical protein
LIARSLIAAAVLRADSGISFSSSFGGTGLIGKCKITQHLRQDGRAACNMSGVGPFVLDVACTVPAGDENHCRRTHLAQMARIVPGGRQDVVNWLISSGSCASRGNAATDRCTNARNHKLGRSLARPSAIERESFPADKARSRYQIPLPPPQTSPRSSRDLRYRQHRSQFATARTRKNRAGKANGAPGAESNPRLSN